MNADKKELHLPVGKGTSQEYLDLGFANRHGLIAKATRTDVPTEDQMANLKRAEGWARAAAFSGVRIKAFVI